MINKIYVKIINYLNRQYTGKIDKKFRNNNIGNMAFYMGNTDTKEKIDTIKEIKKKKVIFHTYWYGEIGRKQAFSIKSFLVTQDLNKCELWLWLDEKCGYDNYENNKYLKPLLNLIKVKKYNPLENIKDSNFEKKMWIFDQTKRLAYRGDGVRMWALNQFGGIWFDLDVMFLKDFTPLLIGSEFCYAWEYQPYGNNAILYLRKDSYINNYLQKKILKKNTTRPWILFDYKDKNLKSLMVYPCFMFDPIWKDVVDNINDIDKPINNFNEFFLEFNNSFRKKENINSYKEFFKESFAYHWHNNWDAYEYSNSYFGIFEKEFDYLLNIRNKGENSVKSFKQV